MLILIVSFVGLMLCGLPVAVAMAGGSLVYILVSGSVPDIVLAQRMISGIESFPLLAVPFFILAGNLMNIAGITGRIYNFAIALVGWMKGGLGQVNIIGSVIFSGMSGTALADAAGLGTIEIKAMTDHGYPKEFSVGVTAASATLGPIIPPSLPFVIYGMMANVSIGALFLGGYIPGILWALTCAVIVWWYTRKNPKLRGNRWATPKEALIAIWRALPSLGLIIIVIGGIIIGFFTPTEGAAIAVLYAFILSLAYRNVGMKDVPKILLDATRTSSVVIFLIALSSIMSYVMTYSRIPKLLGEWLVSVTDSKVVFLLIMMVMLLIIGIPLDATPAVLIFTPIFLPIAVQYYDIHPVHFGMMMVFNMGIAVISPPSAPVLFVGARVAGQKVENVIKPLMPFFIALIVMLLIIQVVPELSLWLPRQAGLIR